MKKFSVQLFIFLVVLFFSVVFVATAQEKQASYQPPVVYQYTYATHPLRIPVMKHMNFPGSEIVIEEILPEGERYDRFIVSYISEQKKIYGVLAIPLQKPPKNGFSGIVLAHGYVPPAEYKNTQEYSELINDLATNGYVVFMPDLRGHGMSEGVAEGAYFSPSYTIDFLNAFSSFARYKDVNPEKIAVWGHSMGGNIVLRSILIEKRIKSAVIWSGVLGSYSDLLYNWNSKTAWNSSNDTNIIKPEVLISQFGSINSNPTFWEEISPLTYVQDISIPIQLHHDRGDKVVPIEFSQRLQNLMIKKGKSVELFEYSHDDHTLSGEDYPQVVSHTLLFFNSTLE